MVLPNFATLCYLRRRNRVLLLRKAKGLFGGGKWNAPGGKLAGGETPEKGAVREMLEETGFKVSGLHFHGILNFYLGGSRRLDQVVFVFSCERHTGEMRRSKEGILRWFLIHQIPYSRMWEDDHEWLPLLLEGRNFVGDFYFTDNYGMLTDYKLHLTP
jgi:8-oxo-dGTP pyrophosphatase MutT (NUDIX family)